MNKREYLIKEEGSLKKYRTEIPNTLIKGEVSQKLSVYDKFLYVYLKSVAGENGVCFQGTGTMSENTGMSTGQISKSKKRLSEHNLISIEKGDYHKGLSDNITIKDIWLKNMMEFHTSSYGEKTSSYDETPPSYSEKTSSPRESNNNPIKEKPLKEKTTTKTNGLEISSKMKKVINCWNKTFEIEVDVNDKVLIKAIREAVNNHTLDELFQAIEFRSLSKFYKEDVPYLRDNPKKFFEYPGNIKNDMKRYPYKLITYDKKCELEQHGKEKKFEMDPDKQDNQGRPKWRMYE